MASMRAKKNKERVITLSPNHEEVEIEIDCGIPRPIYAGKKCYVDPRTIFKWGDHYQMFREEIFLEISLLPRDTYLNEGVYQSINKSHIHRIVFQLIVLPCAEVII
jgi:hypothetical protein